MNLNHSPPFVNRFATERIQIILNDTCVRNMRVTFVTQKRRNSVKIFRNDLSVWIIALDASGSLDFPACSIPPCRAVPQKKKKKKKK